MSTIDLNNPPGTTSASRSGRRWVRLTKDLALFFAALLVFGMIVLLCYRALSSPQTSAEEKKWAMSVLTAAAGGIIGYLIRK